MQLGNRLFQFRRPDGSLIAEVREPDVHGTGWEIEELEEPYELWVLEDEGWRRVGPGVGSG